MEDFVTYEQARILKDLGFDWKCNYLYDEDKKLIKYDSHQEFYDEGLYYDCISAPSLNQTQKWLREVKGIDIIVFPIIPEDIKKYHWVIDKNNDLDFRLSSEELHDTYEQALSAGIDKALELK